MFTRTLQSAISGVLYAEDFDEPLLAPPDTNLAARDEPELIVPHFNLDELRAATEQAREEGRDAERRATATSIAAQRVAALTTLAEQVLMAQETSIAYIEQALDALAQTALSLFAAALPALCAAHAQAEVRAVLHRVLPPARQLPELQIRVHPSIRDAIEGEAQAILESLSSRLIWINSDSQLPGDIAVFWKGGSAQRDTAAICHEISDAVVALFSDKRDSVNPEGKDGQ